MQPAGAAILRARRHAAAIDRLKTLGTLPLWANVAHPSAAELLGRQFRLGIQGSSFGLTAPFAVYTQPSGVSWAIGWLSDSYIAHADTQVGGISITAGRAGLAWGPAAAGGLLFSSSSGPFDLIQVRGRWRAIRFSKTVGWLDAGRSLIATRFDFVLRTNLRLALGESIVMKGAPYLPYLLSPSPWLVNQYIAQEARGFADNHLLSLDIEWLPRPGLRLFAELLIDDFTVPTPTANFPSRWGLTVGLHRASVDPYRDLRALYTIVPNWTYSSGDPGEHYQLRGRPLGHPLGADFDMLQIRWARSEAWAVWATLIRKGEGQVGRIWMDEAEARQFMFLRGVVEQSIVLGIERVVGQEEAWGGLITPWVAYRRNAGHIAGLSRLDWGIGLEFSKSF